MKTFNQQTDESRADMLEEIHDTTMEMSVDSLKELLYEFDFIQDPDVHNDRDSLIAPLDAFMDWVRKMNDIELEDIYNTLEEMEIL
jgi:hypothetical protein